MTLFYNFIIVFYRSAVLLASWFGNKKAKLWIMGRVGLFEDMENMLRPNEKRIWVHAASLGEFEQGRPIIERIREQHPEYKIVVTFFSPSGYEVRKNYAGADYIFYMPADTPFNALRFVDLVNPEMVFFIKYEFWYNFLNTLKQRQIPVYLCSAIFRPSQLFFKWYGGWYRKSLSMFEHLFVQNPESKVLLNNIGVDNVTVAGDTRFDRVYAIAMQARQITDVQHFAGNSTCLIAGSTWEPDENILARYINQASFDLKYIIAPHEIDAAHITRLEQSITKKSVRYSQWTTNPHGEYQVLIIDNIGMLSSLYRYGKVAYIGGGFGKGIHNILEAATFGLPVLFGPNHTKFSEALNLIAAGGAFPISDYESTKEILDALFGKLDYLTKTGTIAASFVKNNIGATDIILSPVFSKQ